ncbi:Rhamnosyltransferase WbbL [Thiorhodovibrio winogradskyi]|uniref:Rhamnosyltransferase WbbL n=1 Tax=Thiorhodovibrio winogradskyi TaxID=77007 RepID=A0ABZ0SEY9_9GAMM|nr:glycosyltransferase family 2 protein [Thiorhodovibrio winogradskyi]
MNYPLTSNVLVSIVSHNQDFLVANLLEDLSKLETSISILVTDNLPPTDQYPVEGTSRIKRKTNRMPKGFAENHNSAFSHCGSPFFCVVNPDVRFLTNPFPQLLDCFADPRVGVAAPLVLASSGNLEDSARSFPTPRQLLAKFLRIKMDISHNTTRHPVLVDWVAGMFMLFRAEAFRDVGGFDEKFYLYYEDVDICARLWRAGWKVIYYPGISIIHDAQRTSRHDPRYMRWHATSMLRYFWKHYGRLPKRSDPLT